MRDLAGQTEQLLSLISQHEKLVQSTLRNTLDLGQLLAARKDAWRAGNLASNHDGLAVGALTRDYFASGGHSYAPAHQPCHPDFPGAMPATDDGRYVLLVVEDDPDDFSLLQRALRKVGEPAVLCWAQTASEALSALAALESNAHIVCVVADVQLPGIDGFELLRLIKSRPSPARLRFAFLTGRRDPLTAQRARNCGADAFFIKPTYSQELIEIARALARLAAETAD